jgi:hypothetical protein
VADGIQQYVEEAGEPWALLERLTAAGHKLGENTEAAAALSEMRVLFDLLGSMGGVLEKIRCTPPFHILSLFAVWLSSKLAIRP